MYLFLVRSVVYALMLFREMTNMGQVAILVLNEHPLLFSPEKSSIFLPALGLHFISFSHFLHHLIL